MTDDERTEAEAKADRLVRRGDLSTAMSLYRAIAVAYPVDQVIAEKLARIEDSLQPMELTHAKARSVGDGPFAASTPTERAEALAARGDFAGAIGAYRQLLAERPDSELIRERLGELFTLAQAMAKPSGPKAAAPKRVSTTSLLSGLLERIASRKR